MNQYVAKGSVFVSMFGFLYGLLQWVEHGTWGVGLIWLVCLLVSSFFAIKLICEVPTRSTEDDESSNSVDWVSTLLDGMMCFDLTSGVQLALVVGLGLMLLAVIPISWVVDRFTRK